MKTVEDFLKELDNKLSILNKETLDFVKLNILSQISDAYERGKTSSKIVLNERLFKTALTEASNFQENLTKKERSTMTYSECKELIINRIFEKYKNKL